MAQKVSFMHDPESSEFTRVLNRRINGYFTEKGISKHANAAMILKSLFGLAWFLGSYWLIMLDRWSNLELIGLFVLHGFGQLFLAFNVAHDANHDACSSRKWVNRLLSYTFDLVGVNSYMWRLMHNDSHHYHVNIQHTDVAIASNGIFRFSPGEKWRPHHRFQHIYAPLVYCLATLEWVLLKDYNWFFRKKQIGNAVEPIHPWYEILILIAMKAIYYGYVLVIPILVLSNPWWAVVLGFLAFHAGIGFSIALIFQTTHVVEGTVYPTTDAHGHIHNNYISHLVATTSDYSWRSPVANWFFGCLNVHTVHHIYPGICHVHYPALTPILMATAAAHGFKYRENRTVAAAFASHLRMLRLLGQPGSGMEATAPAREGEAISA
jgi:linoleoyl-CoA desaturase